MLAIWNFRAGALVLSVVAPLKVSPAGYRQYGVSCENVFEETIGKVRLIIICKDIGEKVQSVTAKENC